MPFVCKDCGEKLYQDTSAGNSICFNCGTVENRNIETNHEWSVSEDHEFTKLYSYKRTNHFKEWISQIQGKEGTVIPKEVINLVKSEIKKEKISSKDKITHVKIKEYLKKLKLNKYYEHIPNIIHTITNSEQLVISDDMEKKLIKMFDDIQKPFDDHCPKNRKNFLSYSYTLYKLFQILGKHNYLVYFPLLKSREKLFEQEAIWRNICNDLNWEFIPCI